MYLAAQIVGIFVTIAAVLSLQFKNMKYVLAMQVLANSLLMLNYALLDAWSGALIGIIAAIQTVIIFLFRINNRKIPLFITMLFMISYVVSTIFTYVQPLDIVPCIAALFFVISIVQEKSSACRFYVIFNSCMWIMFDIGTGAWTTIITHGFSLLSAIIGIIRLDRNK